MKNLLFILLTVVLFSCSGDDSNETTNSSHDFNPPAWIQGTWAVDNGLTTPVPLFKFTSHDMCNIISNTEQCNQGLIDSWRKSGQNASTNEIITDTKYKVTISFEGGQNVYYEFSKVSSTEIKWSNSEAKLIKM